MIPIRMLFVDDAFSHLHALKEDLESSGGLEIITASSPASGMLSLARHQPDVLLINPCAGRGTMEEWRRAIEHYRSARPLGVILLVHHLSARDLEIAEETADLGLCEHPFQPEIIREILARWAGTEETLSRAA